MLGAYDNTKERQIYLERKKREGERRNREDRPSPKVNRKKKQHPP